MKLMYMMLYTVVKGPGMRIARDPCVCLVSVRLVGQKVVADSYCRMRLRA